jgi:hypothetical protein
MLLVRGATPPHYTPRSIRLVSISARNYLSRLPSLGAFAFASLVIVLTFAKFSNEPVMVGDLSTYVLPADALLRQGNAIYVDYFDIKPPITYVMFIPWLAAFGKSLLGMWIYYLLWLASVFMLTWLTIRRLLCGWLALLPFFSLCVTLVAFGILEEILFITEIVGLTLVILAMWLMLRWPDRWISYALAGFLTVLAGQTKEVFLLTPAFVVPAIFLLKEHRSRNLLACIGGGAAALIVVFGSLALWNPSTISEYIRILGFKGDRFPFPTFRAFTEQLIDVGAAVQSWLPLIAIFILAVIALGLWNRYVSAEQELATHKSGPRQRATWIVSVFAAAILAAFIWQGAPPLVHYAASLVFPVTFVIALLLGRALAWTEDIPSQPIRVGVVVVLLVGILPAASSGLWVAGRTTGLDPIALARSIQDLESPEATRTYDRIAEIVGADECIQVAYGWAASAAYLYSERDPCSRFVVPPLALDDVRISELQEHLVRNPPSLLVVDPRLAGETTYDDNLGDPDNFVFPFESVAARCYENVPGEPTLFTVPAESSMTLAACIETELQAMRDSRQQNALPGP